MCASVVSDITKPISNPIKKVSGQSTSKSRAKDAVTAAATRKTVEANQAKAKDKKIDKTRKQQIQKFGSNVAAGGAKRAANI